MLINVVKGMLIGLANIIPGVSGGTMAVSMGIYDKLIYAINHLLKERKKSIAFLTPIAIGMALSVVFSSFGIGYLFKTFPVQTNLFFIGLILGSLPIVWGKVKKKRVRFSYIFIAGIFFGIVVAMAWMKNQAVGGAMVSLSLELSQLVILFFVGVIAAGTMVVPGVSGSMMLLLLGYYNPILDTIRRFILAATKMDVSMLVETSIILMPFGFGVAIGFVVIARIIEYIFREYPLDAYWAIIGLLLASPIAIIIIGSLPAITFMNLTFGLVMLVCGYLISINLGD